MELVLLGRSADLTRFSCRWRSLIQVDRETIPDPYQSGAVARQKDQYSCVSWNAVWVDDWAQRGGVSGKEEGPLL